MPTPSIFGYNDYRSFFTDYLREQGWSYRSFVAKYGRLISLAGVAKGLVRGDGARAPSWNLSPELLAQLAKTLKFSDAELAHLILLRLENDAAVLAGPHGSSFRTLMRLKIRESKDQAVHGDFTSQPLKDRRRSKSAETLADLFDRLPERFRTRILEAALNQGRIFSSRQTGHAGIHALRSVISALEELLKLGAP